MKHTVIKAWAGLMLFLILLSLMVGAAGCNAEKRAARQEQKQNNKALRFIQKAERVQPNELAKWCAKRYNPIDSIYERIIYKPGEVIRDTTIETEIEIVRDTVFVIRTKIVTEKKTDTVDLSRFQSESNKAALDSMANRMNGGIAKRDNTIKDQGETIAGQKVTIRISLIALTILAAYTLLRWVLRIWNIKLP